MVKKIVLISLMLALTACETQPVKHEVIEKQVPTMYVPKPPTTERPPLASKQLSATDRRDIGKLSKAVGDDLIIVLAYSDILETIINKYKELAASNPDLSKLPPEEQKKFHELQDFFNKLGKDAPPKDK